MSGPNKDDLEDSLDIQMSTEEEKKSEEEISLDSTALDQRQQRIGLGVFLLVGISTESE